MEDCKVLALVALEDELSVSRIARVRLPRNLAIEQVAALHHQYLCIETCVQEGSRFGERKVFCIEALLEKHCQLRCDERSIVRIAASKTPKSLERTCCSSRTCSGLMGGRKGGVDRGRMGSVLP